MCTTNTVKLFGSFPQHQHGAAQEVKATTKMQGKPPRAPVWGLPAQKVPSDSCSGEKQPQQVLQPWSSSPVSDTAFLSSSCCSTSACWGSKSSLCFSRSSPLTACFSLITPKTPGTPWGAFPCHFIQGWSTKAQADGGCNCAFLTKASVCYLFSRRAVEYDFHIKTNQAKSRHPTSVGTLLHYLHL